MNGILSRNELELGYQLEDALSYLDGKPYYERTVRTFLRRATAEYLRVLERRVRRVGGHESLAGIIRTVRTPRHPRHSNKAAGERFTPESASSFRARIDPRKTLCE